MKNISPSALLAIFGTGVTFFALMLVVNIAGLGTIPKWVLQLYVSILILIFMWWPIDMAINWEKRTDRARRKDTVILILVGTLILFIYPYYFLALPLVPVSIFAGIVGIFFPLLFMFFKNRKEHRITIDVPRFHYIALKEPRAQEFLGYFPDAKHYLIGLSKADGDRLHLLLHHREPYEELPGAQIDYVLDIGFDRRSSMRIGKEQLQCYIFYNDKGNARIGFLPSSNIGRALDYGFTDEELENAIEQTKMDNQNWPKLRDDPLPIQHYPGKSIRLK